MAAGPAGDWPKAWTAPTQPFRILDNLWYVGSEGIASYLITTPKGHILIDGGMPTGGALVAASVRKLGFRLQDVKYLLNTHAHIDHAGGLAELKRLTGARLVASAADTPTLERGSVDYGPSAGEPFPPVKVDQVASDNGRLGLGPVVMTAHLTPGHTKGCTTWTTRLVHRGKPREVMFWCSTTVAGHQLAGRESYPGMARDYAASFRTLKALKADVFLAPHPEFARIEQKRARAAAGDRDAFIDPGEAARVIGKSQMDFEAELWRQREDVKSRERSGR
jgi:metallo-beta-lactamase class B